WHVDELTLDGLREFLTKTGVDIFGVRNIPNRRVARGVRAVEILSGPSCPVMVGDLQTALNETPLRAFTDPEDVRQVSDECGYSASISWSQGVTDGSYDVVFWRGSLRPAGTLTAHGSFSDYANNPLREIVARRLMTDL